MQSSITRLDDGTYDIVQRGHASGAFAPETLQAFYWRALRNSTFGLVRFRNDSIKILGVAPVLLRFGPMSDGRRAIVGGIFSRQPYGAIRWSSERDEVVVAVEKFAPLLKGPFWRFETWLHDLVGRRFVVLAGRAAR